jgi:anaphase-promoting complex subunit 6
MREGEVEKLRAVVRDCLGKHLYSSAIFFADKLATLAGNATQDLYMQVLTLSISFNRLSDF